MQISKESPPKNKKRVGVFGGSFNPPTIAHFQVFKIYNF